MYRWYVSFLFRNIEKEEDQEEVVYTTFTHLLPVLELLSQTVYCQCFFKKWEFPLIILLGEHAVCDKIVKLGQGQARISTGFLKLCLINFLWHIVPSTFLCT